mmetsp:Transcript_25838/g.56086  ORF Transcript_25838/g.56086 Transcript_25838/m.56086 type:complete len:233 (-) Transcript_25838:224-922(-)
MQRIGNNVTVLANGQAGWVCDSQLFLKASNRRQIEQQGMPCVSNAVENRLEGAFDLAHSLTQGRWDSVPQPLHWTGTEDSLCADANNDNRRERYYRARNDVFDTNTQRLPRHRCQLGRYGEPLVGPDIVHRCPANANARSNRYVPQKAESGERGRSLPRHCSCDSDTERCVNPQEDSSFWCFGPNCWPIRNATPPTRMTPPQAYPEYLEYLRLAYAHSSAIDGIVSPSGNGL